MNANDTAGDWDTPTRVTGERVSLVRRLSREGNDVIATIELTLDGDGPVEVDVVDDVPDSWSVKDIDVHPTHRPRDFDAGLERFSFRAEVSDGQPVEVVYGVRLEAPGAITPPDPPRIEREVSAADPDDSEPGNAAGKPPVWAGENDDEDGPETEDGAFAWGADAQDGSGDSDDVDDERRHGQGASEDSRPGSTAEREDLVEALAADIQAGTASEAALETLREALSPEEGQRDSVRLNHLQSRVEEFAAYADTLGNAIDEHGDLNGFLDEHVARVDALEADVGDVTARLEETTDNVETIDVDLEDVDAVLESTTADVETLRNRLSAVDERLDGVDDLAEDLEAVREELDQLRRHHGDDIRDLEGALGDLESTVDDAKVELHREIESLEGDVERLDATRQRLALALEADEAPEDGLESAN